MDTRIIRNYSCDGQDDGPPSISNLFNEQSRADLAKHCRVIDWSPAQNQPYPDSDILLASWGCPKFDAMFLEAMLSLKMVVYAAGTVKKIVSDEFWNRGIPITSAAAANTIAVAENTVAAMVCMTKKSS